MDRTSFVDRDLFKVDGRFLNTDRCSCNRIICMLTCLELIDFLIVLLTFCCSAYLLPCAITISMHQLPQ